MTWNYEIKSEKKSCRKYYELCRKDEKILESVFSDVFDYKKNKQKTKGGIIADCVDILSMKGKIPQGNCYEEWGGHRKENQKKKHIWIVMEKKEKKKTAGKSAACSLHFLRITLRWLRLQDIQKRMYRSLRKQRRWFRGVRCFRW